MHMTQAEIGTGKLSDLVFCGIRVSIGIIFLLHGIAKLGNEMFIGWMSTFGISPEMAMIIAIAEIVPGILLIFGVLSRLASSILAIIMVAAIFIVKGATSITGEQGIEFDLVLLAGVLVIAIAGPGRLSISHVIKKIPRSLH
ncbi:MAG: DoxX family protein [Cenarchaeum symbiont of Oopsacas minuta]|nr:DoxX family protein [Cenarchaeum symbiont of Oopsacas minuta]